MNREELREALRCEHIQDRCYSLEPENFDPDEALCLRQEGDKWVVYYSERGSQTGKLAFGSETGACLYMLQSLVSDPTTKVGWSSGFSMLGGA